MIKAAKLDLESLTDEEFGKLLLNHYVEAEAEVRGVPADSFTADFIATVRGSLWELDQTDARILPLQVAIKTAAAGDYKKAGAIARSYWTNEVNWLALPRIIAEEKAMRLRGPKAGGNQTAKVKNAAAHERNRKIIAAHKQLLADGKTSRETPGMLAARFNMSPRQIRRIVK